MATAHNLAFLAKHRRTFGTFFMRFADLFTREEPRLRAMRYMRALFGELERRNGEQLARALKEGPRGTQRLLTNVPWSADKARDRLLKFTCERFADDGGIAVLELAHFPKSGKHSVGVARQPTQPKDGPERRVNSQMGVFLGYVSGGRAVLVDRRLYLPESWAADVSQREKAQVPAWVKFRRPDQIAAAQLTRAKEAGLPLRWVVTDVVFDAWEKFDQKLRMRDLPFVLRVPADLRLGILTKGDPAHYRGGYHYAPQTLEQYVETWEMDEWRRLDTTRGPRRTRTARDFMWALRSGIRSSGVPTGGEGLMVLARRHCLSGALALYVVGAPADTHWSTVARAAMATVRIDKAMTRARRELGLDQYEVRTWPGWHRHITLCMMAFTWAASVEHKSRRASRK